MVAIIQIVLRGLLDALGSLRDNSVSAGVFSQHPAETPFNLNPDLVKSPQNSH